MMKYYRITADYRPHGKHPTYDFCVDDNVTKKEIKAYFSNVYSWLKIFEVEEITKDEAQYVRTLKRTGD